MGCAGPNMICKGSGVDLLGPEALLHDGCRQRSRLRMSQKSLFRIQGGKLTTELLLTSKATPRTCLRYLRKWSFERKTSFGVITATILSSDAYRDVDAKSEDLITLWRAGMSGTYWLLGT